MTKPSQAVTVYAHTNLQLFNQLHRDGYTSAEIQQIRKAHEFAVLLFACRFSCWGEPFIVHVIGTASVLSTFKVSAQLVAAGLLHNVYGTGDFGDGRIGVTSRRRAVVHSAVGEGVEGLVYAFHRSLKWSPERVNGLLAHLDSLSSYERDVLLLRLADLVEHYRDLGQAYGGRLQQARDKIAQVGDAWLHAAEHLVGPRFRAVLRQLFAETDAADLPPELCGLTGYTHSFVVLPRSYRERLPVLLKRQVRRGYRRFRQLRSRLLGLSVS